MITTPPLSRHIPARVSEITFEEPGEDFRELAATVAAPTSLYDGPA
jgi:hypothetical protein